MTVAPAETAARAKPVRHRAAVEYAVGGDLRYLAHHDELRLLTRALVRAGWPLKYSGGFNPRPRLTLPLPRNLGVAAQTQLAVLELAAPRGPAELAAALAPQLPGGCALLRVIAPAPSAQPHPQSVTYEFEPDAADQVELGARCARLLEQAVVTVARESAPGRPTRPFDIRPYLLELTPATGVLRMHLAFRVQRTARPAEVLTALGLPAARYQHRLRRAAVRWDMDIAGPSAGPAMHERNDFGNPENHSQRN